MKTTKSSYFIVSHDATYLNGPFQKGLDYVIGSTKIELSYYQTEVYICDPWGGPNKNIPPYDPNNPCWTLETTIVQTIVPTPGDGVVPQESAWSLPGRGQAFYKAEKVNHEQLKNHTEMERIFRLIFDGTYKPNIQSSEFFIVPRRIP